MLPHTLGTRPAFLPYRPRKWLRHRVSWRVRCGVRYGAIPPGVVASSRPLATLCDQFLKERTYLKNVTPRTLVWYQVAHELPPVPRT